MANEKENLIEAVIKGDTAAVKKLLIAGVNPDMYLDDAKLRPLHFAAQNNRVEIAHLLLEAGASPLARTDPDGQTPLEIAQLHKHQRMISLLSAYIIESS